MKTQCENCSARYEIPNERAVGKVLRVRCKRCQNVMMVVGPTDSFADGDPLPPTLRGISGFTSGTGSEFQATSMRVREDYAPIWWVGISGKPHGPYTRDEVFALIDRGDVHARTRLWRRPWAKWERICESPLLSWAFERAIARVSEDAALLAGRDVSCVFDKTAMMTDGEGWFPDPTMKSGWLILDEETQAYLETCAQRGMLGSDLVKSSAAKAGLANAAPTTKARFGSSEVSLSGLPPPRPRSQTSYRPMLAAASFALGIVASGVWWWAKLSPVSGI